MARMHNPRGEAGSETIPATAGSPEHFSTHDLPAMNILLAEDNLVNQRVALRVLEKEGHRVVVANNGVEALQAFAQHEFDVVLMDVQMPEMSGFEATAKIRERELTRTPIIAMTAHAMSGDRERCLAAGMDDYLAKPIRASGLLDMVAKYRREKVA